MTFQSSVRWIGITGWMFRISCVPLFGPTLKLVLFWNGKLIRSAIGFWNFSASAVVSSAGGERGVGSRRTWLAPDGGAGCAKPGGTARTTATNATQIVSRLGSLMASCDRDPV